MLETLTVVNPNSIKKLLIPTPAPSSEFPIAPLVAPPRIHRCSAKLIQPDSSSSGSPSDSLLDSLSVHSPGCDTLGQDHSGPSTRVVSPRSAPLSTLYPATTSESSLGSSFERSSDSSSPSSGPSRKRCKSPTTSDSGEEHMEIGTANTEAVADLGVGDGVGAPTEDGLETKTQVCLLCEVILKQIPAFNFFCASFESITAIEKLGKW
ncbi:hypothetical protein Tco_1326867 [Tanacetum coccineum]